MNSYGYHEGYIYIWYRYTCTYAKCTCYHIQFHNFMSVDRKAFKTAVWEAQKKNQLFFSYMIACTMFPSSLSAEINFIKYDPLLWWRNHESYTSLPYARPASKYLCIFAWVFSLRRKGCARGGVASCMKGSIGKCIFLRQNSNCSGLTVTENYFH